MNYSEARWSYMAYLKGVRMLSPATLLAYSGDLRRMERFLGEEGLEWFELGSRDARSFMTVLSEHGHAASSINRIVSGVRRFYHYHWRMGRLAYNPFDGVEKFKQGRKLPRVLDRKKLEVLFDGLNGEDFSGRRDRFLVEFLYSTGCRINEAVGVSMGDFHGYKGCIKVKGKGNKERMVFLGSPAIEAMEAYLPLRIALLDGRDSDALFLNQRGGRLTPRGASVILERHSKKLGLPGKLNPHIFRHTFATDLLNGGAELREVQEFLGHASISTTQIYTHLGIERLMHAHREYHPHGKVKGKARVTEEKRC